MNWGWKLAIGSGLFMAMIIYFVIQSFQTNINLVSDNYYEDELNFQSEMVAQKNANALEEKVEVVLQGEEILISYPEFFVGNGSEGEVLFYKPANNAHDKTFKCNLNKSLQVVAKSNLEKGRYFAKVNIKKGEQAYYFEQRLTIN